MSRIDARVHIVNTEGGRTFTERFDATPIRIGRALDSDLFLPHRSIAAHHGELAIGPRFAYFRSRAWLRSSRIDGVRVPRGRAVKLTHESVISLGPYEVTVWFRVRDRSYERERKVTPLVLATILPGPETHFGRATGAIQRAAEQSLSRAIHDRPKHRAVAR
jgi:pSer/pThr/pTyr-binding forkhead associated (FHA) protein